MKKRIVAAMCSTLLAAGLLAGCGLASNTTQTAADNDVIKIGAVVPLTGDVPALGESAKNGYQLAVDKINANGGIDGKQVVIIFEDDENQPSKAPTVAQKLITQDHVVGIVGATNSKCSIPMGPICTQNSMNHRLLRIEKLQLMVVSTYSGHALSIRSRDRHWHPLRKMI